MGLLLLLLLFLLLCDLPFSFSCRASFSSVSLSAFSPRLLKPCGSPPTPRNDVTVGLNPHPPPPPPHLVAPPLPHTISLGRAWDRFAACALYVTLAVRGCCGS